MITILQPGAHTTVQDLGRPGQLRYGIPPSGPMDVRAFVLANRLVGNPDGAAALECTILGPRFETEAAGAIAVTGADMPVTVNGADVAPGQTVPLAAGDLVKVGTAREGVRGYVAFAGGLDVPFALGSRATYVRGRLGGLEGRALRRGDTLAVLGARRPVVRRRVKPGAAPAGAEPPELATVLGPQDDRFTGEGLEAFLGGTYAVLPQSDRMGVRLSGPRIAHARGHDIISDGIPLGGVQVVGDGQPIVLLVDRQSTGGYTKVATVCSYEIGRLAQVKPGRSVRFRAVDLAAAHEARRQWRASFDDALEDIR
ncbi:MAG: biotin-dependent carboxyltransferase [Candidatus Rokubacteria bacterium]|nr:biotin-dependent carboxyltransferase [Candidatus Rokubacteria bacterium]MBI3825322.1 biotin-dependent carboxyltransferase [Candidatus Rokubacteria bacterium]